MVKSAKDKTFTVYMHVSPSNKRYIGITSQGKPSWRWGNNGDGYKNNQYFYSAICKYGWNNFEHIILSQNITLDEASKLEKAYISEYKTCDSQFGYNLTDGGEINIPGESTRKKLSDLRKGQKHSAAWNEKISISHKNNQKNTQRYWIFNSELNKQRRIPCTESLPEGWEKGRLPHTEVTREKISKKLTGRKRNTPSWSKGKKKGPLPASTKEKISKALSGRALSDEHKEKLKLIQNNRSESWQKNLKAATSKPRSEETISKIKEKRSNMRWVTNGVETVHVHQSEISTYLDRGWHIGRNLTTSPELRDFKSKNMRGRVHICKGDERKMIFPEELESFLAAGWVKGRKFK